MWEAFTKISDTALGNCGDVCDQIGKVEMTSYKFSNNYRDEIDGTITFDQNEFTCYCVNEFYKDAYLDKRRLKIIRPTNVMPTSLKYVAATLHEINGVDAPPCSNSPTATTAHSITNLVKINQRTRRREGASARKRSSKGAILVINRPLLILRLRNPFLKVFDLFAFPTTFWRSCFRRHFRSTAVLVGNSVAKPTCSIVRP